MQSIRAAAPVVAAVLVVVLAVAWLDALGSGPLSLIGKVVAFAGLAGAAIGAVRLLRGRSDPYDLNRLWESGPENPEEADEMEEDGGFALCHRCGHSVPERIGICPECGNRIGF